MLRFFLLFFSLWIFSLEASCKTISTKKQKIAIIFHKLKNKSSCVEELSQYALYAALAGRLAESIWASTKALQEKKLKREMEQKLYYTRGYAYYLANRQEEAIQDLKKAAFAHKAEESLAQKAHLLLIASYFAKAKDQFDVNVHYLVKLFLKKYPTSEYKPNLLTWYSQT